MCEKKKTQLESKFNPVTIKMLYSDVLTLFEWEPVCWVRGPWHRLLELDVFVPVMVVVVAVVVVVVVAIDVSMLVAVSTVM